MEDQASRGLVAPRSHTRSCRSGSGSREPPTGAYTGDGCRAEVLPGGQQKHQGQVEMGQGLLGPHLGPQGWRWTSGDLQNLLGSSKQQEVLPPAPPLPAWSRGSHGADDDGNPCEVVVLVVMVAS